LVQEGSEDGLLPLEDLGKAQLRGFAQRGHACEDFLFYFTIFFTVVVNALDGRTVSRFEELL
jgi:hypothetical protein